MRYEPDSFECHQPSNDFVVSSFAPALAPLSLGVPESTRPAPAVPDVPASVGGMQAASYAALIGALFVATAGSASSIFAIAIAALFVAIFFTVPRIFFAVEPMTEKRPEFGKFLQLGMETQTGHSGGPAALVQMFVVPVFLTLAVLAMGLIIKLT